MWMDMDAMESEEMAIIIIKSEADGTNRTGNVNVEGS